MLPRVFLLLALLSPVPALAQNPDFNGEWVLDNSLSKDTGLASASQTIRVEDGKFHVARTVRRAFQEPMSFEYFYVTDGSLHNVTTPLAKRDLTAVWDGDELVINWDFEFNGIKGHGVETWKKKRKGIEILVEVAVPQGERTFKHFYVPKK